jgi:hypothetical protein
MSPRVGDVSAENNAEIESTRHSPEGYIVPLWRRRYRHMMAMHLLQSGVDITVAGPEDTATTHMYVEADSP